MSANIAHSSEIDPQDRTEIGLREEFNIDYAAAREYYSMADSGRELAISNMVILEIDRLKKHKDTHHRVKKLTELSRYLSEQNMLASLTPMAANLLLFEYKTNGQAIPDWFLVQIVKGMKNPVALEKLILDKEMELLRAVDADDELQQIFNSWDLPPKQGATDSEKEDAIRKLIKMKCDIWGVSTPEIVFSSDGKYMMNGIAVVADVNRYMGCYVAANDCCNKAVIYIFGNHSAKLYGSLHDMFHVIPHEVDHHIQQELVDGNLPDYQLCDNIDYFTYKEQLKMSLSHMNDAAYRSTLMERWAYRSSAIWGTYAWQGIDGANYLIGSYSKELQQRTAQRDKFWQRLQKVGYHVCA